MQLNEYGKIVEQQWLWLAKQYSYISLDKYIIMPNHFHGIITINNPINPDPDPDPIPNPIPIHFPYGTVATVPCPLQIPKIKSLSDIIGAFKTTSSKLIHRTGLIDFKWQRSFYDHIIQNFFELNNIQLYIQNNPSKWEHENKNGIIYS